MTRAPAILYYVHDPMCSWCWGFRPVLLQLKQQLAAPVTFRSLVGGLAADSDVPMPVTLQRNLQATWQRIQQAIPGTRFNFDFWTRNIPRRSTYPACRAVIAARRLDARLEDEMTFGIQQAYYLQAKNPSDLETLGEIALNIGLDQKEFEQLMHSSEIEDLFTQELDRVRAIHVSSFPSLVLQLDASLYPVTLDYISAQKLLDEINRLVSRHP